MKLSKLLALLYAGETCLSEENSCTNVASCKGTDYEVNQKIGGKLTFKVVIFFSKSWKKETAFATV